MQKLIGSRRKEVLWKMWKAYYRDQNSLKSVFNLSSLTGGRVRDVLCRTILNKSGNLNNSSPCLTLQKKSNTCRSISASETGPSRNEVPSPKDDGLNTSTAVSLLRDNLRVLPKLVYPPYRRLATSICISSIRQKEERIPVSDYEVDLAGFTMTQPTTEYSCLFVGTQGV